MSPEREMDLRQLANDPNKKFLAPLHVFYSVNDQPQDTLALYLRLRKNYFGTQHTYSFTPEIVTQIADLYRQGCSSKAIADQLCVPESSLDRVRPIMLATMMHALESEGNFVQFDRLLEDRTGKALSFFLQTKMISNVAISEDAEKTIKGVLAIPRLIHQDQSLRDIAILNPHVVFLFDKLAQGFDLAEILLGADKGPYYLPERRDWLKQFARGERSTNNLRPLASIAEDLLLSYFMHGETFDNKPVDWDKSLSFLAEELFTTTGKRNAPNQVEFKSGMREFYRLVFAISVYQEMMGYEIPFNVPVPQSFSPSDFLSDYLNPLYNDIISNFYVDYYFEHNSLPPAFRDMIFHDWKNYYHTSSIDKWSTTQSAFLWSANNIRHALTNIKRAIANISLQKDTSWHVLAYNRDKGIRQLEDRLFNQLDKLQNGKTAKLPNR